MSRWTLVAADLDTAQNLGELNDAQDVNVSFSLNQPTTVAFSLPLAHRFASILVDGDTLVKVYQTVDGARVLRVVAEIAAVEEVGNQEGERTIVVQGVEAGAFRLAHRLIGKSASGYEVTTATDRGAIASAIISAVNSTSGTDGGGYTGVRVGAVLPSSTTTITPPVIYQPVLETITGLAESLDGFDFEFLPVDGETDTAGITISEFVCAASVGSVRQFVFEYGTGRSNVAEYHRQVTRQNLATAVYALPQGYGDKSGGTVGAVTEAVLVPPASGARLHETTITDAVPVSLLSDLAELNLNLRSIPQETIAITPVVDASVYGVDYSVGDVITVRAKVNGDTRLDAQVRVYGVDIVLDVEGREAITVTLSANGA